MRKSAASLPCIGLNQTIWPLSSMIIGPSWPRPALGARNTSPGARPGLAVVTVTEGGSKSGRVRNVWTVPRPTLGSSTGRSERVVSSPISKEKSPPSALTTSRSVVTVTRSFSSNGSFGTKLTPWPSECAFKVPGWSPLREPLTVTVPSAAASPPRNEIVVLGWAVSVPGIG